MFDRVMLVVDKDADLVHTKVVALDAAQAALHCLAEASQPAISLILLLRRQRREQPMATDCCR